MALLQLGFLVTFSVLAGLGKLGDKSILSWAIPASILCKSIIFGLPIYGKLEWTKDFTEYRNICYLVVCVWKILLTFLLLLAFTGPYISINNLFKIP